MLGQQTVFKMQQVPSRHSLIPNVFLCPGNNEFGNWLKAGSIHICRLCKSTNVSLDSTVCKVITDNSNARSKKDEASGVLEVVCYIPGTLLSSLQIFRCRNTMESGSWLNKVIEINSSLVYQFAGGPAGILFIGNFQFHCMLMGKLKNANDPRSFLSYVELRFLYEVK